MPTWIGSLLNGILGMTVLTLIVILALPLLARRYRERTVYGLLIVCLLGFLIPWRPLITPRPAVTVELPAETVRQLRPMVRPPVQEAEAILYDSEIARSANTAKPTVPAPRRPVNIFAIALGIWLAGALGVLGLELARYICLIRLLKRWREPVEDAAAVLTRAEARKAGLKTVPPVWRMPGLPSPMVCGLIRPEIYLPDTLTDPDDLRLSLRHELAHIRQHDVPVKWLTMLICAIHWPNPVVWLLRRMLNQYCELSCDERVMSGSDLNERTRYSETIIAAIRVGERAPAALCTAFQGGLKHMKRRILQIMDIHSRRIGAAAVAVVVCLTVLAGSLMSFSAADAAAKLPDFPDSYDREAEELITFPEPYPAVVGSSFGPAYNYSDDPEYPAALYVPGTPLEITGHKWRAEHIPGITGTDGMVWLQVNVLAGERLNGVWMPETFVLVNGSADQAPPTGVLKAPEGQSQVSLYARIIDKAPNHTFPTGTRAELISWQPGYAQVNIGGATGYVSADQFELSGEINAQLKPAWAYGFDSWHLGYGDYYNQYIAWFNEMSDRYGSYDMWSNELKVEATRVQREYGLLNAGDPVYVQPQEGDITEEEAIAIGKQLTGDTGAADENGIPYYAWQAHFMYTEGQDEEPYWMLRAWATHTDMDRQNVRLTRTGELIDITPFRDDPGQHSPYYSIGLMLLYGEAEGFWPISVRSACDPEGCPPLKEGWKTEEEVRAIALQAIEDAFGADKRAAVEDRFEVYASYYNYGKYEETDTEDRIFWTVWCINRTPRETEEIQVMVNMDGTLRGEPTDTWYGELDFTPGSNG